MRGKIYSGRAVFPRRQPTRTLYASRIVFAIMSRNIVTATHSFAYFSPHAHMAAKMSFKSLALSVAVYST